MAARPMMFLVLALAIGGIVVGCGGSDDNGSPDGSAAAGDSSGDAGDGSGGGSDEDGSLDGSPAEDGSSPLTKSEFVKQASAICEGEKGNISNEFTEYLKQNQSSGKSQEEVFAGMMKAVLLPVIEDQLKGLEELEPPPADKAEVEAFIKAQRRGVESMAKLKRLSEGPAGEKYLEPASRMAKAYGIKACAQS